MPYVISIVAARVEREYFFDKTPIVIGRLPKNDIAIKENSISRQHAQIVESTGHFWVEDLKSTNFVYVNKRKVLRERLNHGDIVNVGGAANLIFLLHPDPPLLEKLLREITDNPEFSAEAMALKQTMASLADELVHHEPTAPGVVPPVQDTELARRLDDLQALYEISYSLNSTLKLDQILRLLVGKLLAVFRAERGHILFYNATRQLETYLSRASEGTLPKGAINLEICNRAMAMARAVVHPEPGQHGPETGQAGRASQPAANSCAMCAPLRVKSNIFGAIYVDASARECPFTRKDLLLFEAMSHQAAIAINNARLTNDLSDKQVKLEQANRDLVDRSTRLQLTNEKLDEKIAELEALNSISRGMNMVSDLDSVLRLILAKMVELLRAERGSVMLCNEETDSMEVKLLLPEPADARPGEVSTKLKIGEGVAGRALRQGCAVAVADGHRNELFKSLVDRDANIRTLLCVPLIQNERRIGVINITNKRDGQAFTENDKQLAMTLANQAAITIENSRNYTMAICDGLTNLYVHRFFQLQLEKEFERTRRHDKCLSLVMLDIDNFKAINDNYGHQFGDVILQEVAALVRREVRTIDLPARYGGEEFVVILPETDSEGALIFAERLRKRIASQSFCYQEKALPVTVSIGVSTHPRDPATNKEQLIGFADKALYYSKATGKNKVSSYSAECEDAASHKAAARHGH
ncbi:MAG: diguanylate cyclase [Candidatus Wallbacteria bacterium]|nr:diguanylate cyclase [Candidatus Wallbacteria bacterium]